MILTYINFAWHLALVLQFVTHKQITQMVSIHFYNSNCLYNSYMKVHLSKEKVNCREQRSPSTIFFKGYLRKQSGRGKPTKVKISSTDFKTLFDIISSKLSHFVTHK